MKETVKYDQLNEYKKAMITPEIKQIQKGLIKDKMCKDLEESAKALEELDFETVYRLSIGISCAIQSFQDILLDDVEDKEEEEVEEENDDK